MTEKVLEMATYLAYRIKKFIFQRIRREKKEKRKWKKSCWSFPGQS